MDPLSQASLFLLQFIAGLVVFTLILRFLIRATYTDWNNQIVKFIAKVTNPICKPFALVLPSKGRWDFAAIGAAFTTQVVLAISIGLIIGQSFNLSYILLFAVSEILNFLFDMMFWLIIIQVVLSWIAQSYNPNLDIFRQLTEPILSKFRSLIPPIGGMDLSPIVAILAIKLGQILIVGSIAQLAQTMV